MAYLFANNATTTLAASATSGATTISVASGTGFPSGGNFTILIDSEILLVTGVAGTTWTVSRGSEGTTAAAHNSGATVTHILTAAPLTSFESRIASAESGLVTAATKLRFVPFSTATVVINEATTAAAIAPTETAAITSLPTTGVELVTGYIYARSNAIDNGNYFRVLHTGSTAPAAVVFASSSNGVNQASSFAVVPSATRTLRYDVSWISGTITYALVVTGYWTTE